MLISLDEVTKSSIYESFSHVLIQKKIGSEFPLTFEMFDEDDVPFNVTMEYSWTTSSCAVCAMSKK